jgi:integrase
MSILPPKGPRKSWYIDFQQANRRYCKGGFRTRREAQAAEAEWKKQLKGKILSPTDMGFEALADEYLDYCERRFVSKTYKGKVFVYSQFLKYVGNFPLRLIDARIIEGYLAGLPSNSNYNRHRKFLCAFFQWAFKRGLVEKNPCIHIEMMPTRPCRKIIPSQEEMIKIMLASGELRPFFLALYSLAGRLGEINRLRWEDVNFEKREAILWTRKGNGQWRPQRKPMNDDLCQELKRLYAKSSGGYVFPNPKTGKPYQNRRKQIRNVCAAAGVPYYGFHAIRHHVASLLADEHKASLPTIQRMLGHTQVSTTARYIQSVTDDLRAAAEKLKIGNLANDSREIKRPDKFGLPNFLK